MTSFGKRLRMLRREKDITMIELAKAIGTTQPTISKYEREVHEPDLPMVKALAEYFNVSVDYMTATTNKREPYYIEGEDTVRDLRDIVAEGGVDISGKSNKELAEIIIKYHQAKELLKSD